MRKENEALLARTFKGMKLSKNEAAALAWLAGWETDTVKNIISAFAKTKKEVHFYHD